MRYGVLDYVYLTNDNLDLVLEPGDVVHVYDGPNGYPTVFGYDIVLEHFDWFFRLIKEDEE